MRKLSLQVSHKYVENKHPPPNPQAPPPQGHSTHPQGPPYVVQTPTPNTGGRPLFTVGCMVSCDRIQALMLPDRGIRSGTKTSAIKVKVCRSDQYWRLRHSGIFWGHIVQIVV